MRRSRSISHSELEAAQTCEAAWDFKYGGHLAGSTLKQRTVPTILSGGSAWGAMLAAWHGNSGNLLAKMEAYAAMTASLDADWRQMQDRGVLIPGVLDKRVDLELKLGAMFEHYTTLCEPFLNLTKIEGEIDVPIPARSGKGSSSMYRFGGRIDGFTLDSRGEWLWECKLRGNITPREYVELGRQYIRYAWARWRETGHPIVGIIIEERLNDVPKPARLVQAGKEDPRSYICPMCGSPATKPCLGGLDKRKELKTVHPERAKLAQVIYGPSHAADQMCTVESYVALCEEYHQEPHQDVVEALRGRVWQVRHQIPFRASELREAGLELVSGAKLIRDLDSGARYPMRIGKTMTCRFCDFRPICKSPGDDLYVDQLFERGVPKRLKGSFEAAASEVVVPMPMPGPTTIEQEIPF